MRLTLLELAPLAPLAFSAVIRLLVGVFFVLMLSDFSSFCPTEMRLFHPRFNGSYNNTLCGEKLLRKPNTHAQNHIRRQQKATPQIQRPLLPPF